MHRKQALTLTMIWITEFICLGALLAPIYGGISLLVGRLVASGATGLTQESAKSVVLWTGAAAAIVSNIAAGWLGDRIVAHGYRRTPLLVAGAIAGGGALIWVPHTDTLAGLTLAWVLAQTGYNLTFATLYGLLADHFDPPGRRAAGVWLSGASLGSLIIGSVTILAGPEHATTMFLPLAIASVPACVLCTLVLTRQPVYPLVPAPPQPRADAAFRRIFTQRMVSQSAYMFIAAFGVEFLLRRLPGPVTDEKIVNAIRLYAACTAVAAFAGMVISALVTTVLARRYGYRAIMIIGSAGLLIANVMLIFATGEGVYIAALLIAGVGTGAYFGCDIAAAIPLVPEHAAGYRLGVFNIARTLPQSLIPALGPAILAIGGTDPFGLHTAANYASFFIVGTVVTLVSLVLIPTLTLPGRERRGGEAAGLA